MLCKTWAMVFVCFYGPSVEVNNSGGSRGGARSPSYFWTKLRSEGPKKNFSRTPLPLSTYIHTYINFIYPRIVV